MGPCLRQLLAGRISIWYASASLGFLGGWCAEALGSVNCYAGDVSVFDVDTASEVSSFDQHGGGITAFAWLGWAPGNFGTVNTRTGVMRVWNVSQRYVGKRNCVQEVPSMMRGCRSTLQYLRIAEEGLTHLVPIPGTEMLIAGFVDGSVGLFDVGRRSMVHRTPPGHTETIFDVEFDPNNKDLVATGSYDGAVKVSCCTCAAPPLCSF